MRRLAMIILSMGLSACAISSQQYWSNDNSTSQFRADEALCRSEASAAADAEIEQGERYENGSDAEIVGAGLGTMLASKAASKQRYRSCMEARGYKR